MYVKIVDAIPTHWKEMLKETNTDMYISKYKFVTDSAKVSRWAYCDIIQTEQVLRKVHESWNMKLPGDVSMFKDYSKHFQNIWRLSKRVKLRDFQYRLLLNKIFCNDVLVHWNKVDSNICNLCQKEKQNITHLMYYCGMVHPVWMKLRALCIRYKIECDFGIANVIFNTVHRDSLHVINLITLICKQYILQVKMPGN